MRIARPLTFFVIGPAESNRLVVGTIPSAEMIGIVGLMVWRAPRPASTMRDPSVSVPSDTGAYPAVTPIVELEDEPAGFFQRVSAARISLAESLVERTLWPAELSSIRKPPRT